MWNRFKTFDPLLFLSPLLLMGVSLVIIYSLTSLSAGLSLTLHQGLFTIMGIVCMAFLSFVNYRLLKVWIWWGYGLGLLGLVAVRLVGHSDFGAQRWINIGFFQLQPSELMKLLVIAALAVLLSRPLRFVTWPQFFGAGLVILVPFVGVLLQPDLGTALIILLIGVGILAHARLLRPHKLVIVAVLVGFVLATVLAFHNVSPFTGLLKKYQRDRLISFVNPGADSSGSGYNVLQSTIAVGSGGLVGKGLGQGSQSQLNFLPVAHADFIFAGISEAWGFVGDVIVLGLLILLIVRLLMAARLSAGEFEMLFCVGVALKILCETTINVGMNIGIMPVTGIPLPFLSYGGTTLLTNALLIGMAQSIVMRHKRLTFAS